MGKRAKGGKEREITDEGRKWEGSKNDQSPDVWIRRRLSDCNVLNLAKLHIKQHLYLHNDRTTADLHFSACTPTCSAAENLHGISDQCTSRPNVTGRANPRINAKPVASKNSQSFCLCSIGLGVDLK